MMSSPFRGDKENNFSGDAAELQRLAGKLEFELKIVPDGIYNADDAARAAALLAAWGADYILVQSSSFASGDFIRPFAEMGVRIGVWAVPEGQPSSEGGLPLNSFTGLNMNNSLLRRYFKGYPHPVKWFFGRVNDPFFADRFAVTIAALRAVINLRGARVGLIGGVAAGFNNLIVDPRDFESKLGIEVKSYELDVLLEKARQVSLGAELDKKAEAFLQPGVRLGSGSNQHLLELAKLQIGFEALVAEEGLDAVAISCWPRFQKEPGVAVCSLVGQLNTVGMVTACEGDVPSAVGMLALHHLTNGDVVTLMDLVSVDPGDDSVLLWHCGPTSPKLANAEGVSMESLWLFDDDKGGRMGLHNDLILKPGDVSVVGFTPNLDGLLVLSGVIDPNKPSYKGSRGWLKQIKVKGQAVDTGSLIETLSVTGYQHHYPLAYGKLTGAAVEMGTYLGIPSIEPRPYRDYLSC
jgi:hypothetical protein